MRTQILPCRQHGGAAVEFGIVLALLITLLAGIFGFGRAFWYYDALSKATRDAARNMSVHAKADIATAGTVKAKDTVVAAATSAGIGAFTSANVRVTCLDKFFNDSSCTDGTAPGGIRVEVVNYTLSVGQYLPFVIGATSSYNTTLAPRTTMRYML
jgi:Flp pilus assembly protein TadG